MARKVQIVSIDDFQVDATTNEDHDQEADVTQYPIESGSDVVDNVHVKSATLMLQCIVSDTPLAPFNDIRPIDSIPSHDAHTKMRALIKARQPITVVTERQVYTNMFVSKVSEPFNLETGDALIFSVSFVQGEFLENLAIFVKIALPVAPKLAKGFAGAKAAASSSADTKRVSVIQKLRGH